MAFEMMMVWCSFWLLSDGNFVSIATFLVSFRENELESLLAERCYEAESKAVVKRRQHVLVGSTHKIPIYQSCISPRCCELTTLVFE